MTRQTRDQLRALHAYRCVERVPQKAREDYKARVNSLGSAVLRDGLVSALAFLQREKDSEAVGLLLDHLASARVPGVQAMKGAELFSAVRGLELRDYMLATREVLEVTVWLRRAVQATFVDKKGAAHAAQGT